MRDVLSTLGKSLGKWKGHNGPLYVTPQTRGSVDYPSTRRILVNVGWPDIFHKIRAESPLYGEL